MRPTLTHYRMEQTLLAEPDFLVGVPGVVAGEREAVDGDACERGGFRVAVESSGDPGQARGHILGGVVIPAVVAGIRWDAHEDLWWAGDAAHGGEDVLCQLLGDHR